MALRLSGQNCKFFTCLLPSRYCQRKLGYKENNTKIEFCPESLGSMLEYWYIERGLLVPKHLESLVSSIHLISLRVTDHNKRPLANYKQLLDEFLGISRIIKVEVVVISRSWRLPLITLTETLIILDITKTESNNCFVIHWTKKMEVMFLLLHWQQATQNARTWHHYP